jgi:hypothetical protein
MAAGAPSVSFSRLQFNLCGKFVRDIGLRHDGLQGLSNGQHTKERLAKKKSPQFL